MILSDREIRIAVREGQIHVRHEGESGSPLSEDSLTSLLSSTSLDLTLAPTVRKWRIDSQAGMDPPVFRPGAPGSNFETIASRFTEKQTLTDEGLILRPQEFVLGWTSEWIKLPYQSRVAARVEGKSSFARHGIGVHVTAPTIHAGFEGQVQLGIFNIGPLDIRLIPGVKVCQLILELVYGTPDKGYRGQFVGQSA